MRTRRNWIAVIAMLAMTVTVVPMAAAVADDEPAAAENEVHGYYYLALGGSVPAGTRQPRPFTRHGYPNLLLNRAGPQLGLTELVNLACPGDDSQEMIDGIGSFCYSDAISQLDAALAFLAANADHVKLITITIGANDILACDPADPAVQVCVQAQLTQLATNLPQILQAINQAAPEVSIVGMNYYNPNLAY